MNLTLKVWRQNGANDKGRLESYQVKDISPDMSFLEMMDVLNDQIIVEGKDPVAFDHDCREGICGSCSMFINGEAHGPGRGITTCQLHMRTFNDGDTIYIEPWRAAAFPVIKDLVTDRSAFDRIIQAGGYVSVNTSGNTQDANSLPIPKDDADKAFDAATCIGCGACVATCKNSSAMLFVSAKVSQLALLPQGDPERATRALHMVEQMDKEGFGNCTNTGACEVECPKEISLENIARLNREYLRASVNPDK
ncbi:MAG: succinate dehydrogenase/fumarate reductase iron-sulfur subunit [Flavobacteriales bacterium]|jgi:succinate dehydrogenase / fumarate reductase, iron-sulfur subunit|nr:succinate dehydrogenase/fumarate reductase iron-sulfur subunit [Flavobacteriales bacterium]MDP4827638.1 succinate dehydrogenase/fumarate reductase iron-sulfur subunit [Flavobacteriales bacterium]